VFSKSIETGWFTEHLLNGIGFQIAAVFPAVRYYITPENENQAVFRIFSAWAPENAPVSEYFAIKKEPGSRLFGMIQLLSACAG
jgi:hypothetical protein